MTTQISEASMKFIPLYSVHNKTVPLELTVEALSQLFRLAAPHMSPMYVLSPEITCFKASLYGKYINGRSVPLSQHIYFPIYDLPKQVAKELIDSYIFGNYDHYAYNPERMHNMQMYIYYSNRDISTL